MPITTPISTPTVDPGLSPNAESVMDQSQLGDLNSGLTGALKDTLNDYLLSNQNATGEDILRYLAQNDSEWAEKWIDYLLEKESLDAANKYTADREDTAYQRLVQDLKAAGLNPAMMFGNSASISASGSQGYIKQSEGANSRSIGNRDKLKRLTLAYLQTQFDMSYKTANMFMSLLGFLI